MLVYKKPIERNLVYLPNRINFYYDYYYYRFSCCKENSDHVLNYYVNYFLEKNIGCQK